MSLDDLNKEIYNSKPETEIGTHEESKFDPWAKMKNDPNIFKEKENKDWQKLENKMGTDSKKALKIGALVLGGIILGLLIFGAVIAINRAAFSEEKVTVKIEGAENVDSNQENSYKIIIENKNRISLNNVRIDLNYSENFSPKSDDFLKIENQSNSHLEIGKVKPKSTIEFKIKGTFFAPQDSVVYLNANLVYYPSNFNSAFKLKNQLGVNIKNSPISIAVSAPQESADGESLDYVIGYKNESDKPFSDMRLKVEYPENYTFSSSSEEPSEADNMWYIGTLESQQLGKIIIKGNIKGMGGEIKILKVLIGSAGNNGSFAIYNQKQTSTKIVISSLSIVQIVDNGKNVNSGDVLHYTLKYKNQGEIGLRDVIISFNIDSPVLDYKNLKIENNGSFDFSQKTIFWKASDVPQLANLEPGQGGEVRLAIPILNIIPIEKDDDKNFEITTLAKIDSPDVPTPIGRNKIIASNQLELKLNSKVVLSVDGFYYDNNISNSGSIPPKVGETTSYTIHWKVVNVSNDINQVKVISSFPSGVKWVGKIFPENEKIEFNERTNEIIWQIGNLDNGVGIISPTREVSFQISIVPQPNQIDREVKLLNPTIFTAYDLFTLSDLKVEAREKDTRLYEDVKLNGGYKVIQ